VRVRKREAGLLLILLGAILAMCGCAKPKPPQPPVPTPPPPPLTAHDGKFWRGDQEFPFRGISFCCDDPGTPGLDEGYRDFWSLASPAALDRAKAGGITFVFMRPGPYASLAPVWPGSGYDAIPHLREAVLAANARGMVVEVGLVDFWGLASGGNLWSDPCAITGGPVPERYLAWVDAVVSSTGDLDVVWNTGNEAFRCLRAPTVWDDRIRAKVREVETARGWPHRLYGVSWWLPDVRPETQPDYVSLQDVFFAPTPYQGKPMLLNEDDGLYHNPAQWRALIAEANAKGGYVSYWRGIQSDAEEAFFLGLGPDPGPRCGSAPPIARLEMGLRAGPNPFVDATPKVCDADWCTANGAPGQGCCAYGSEDAEGWAQRLICESEKGAPYVWSLNGARCTPYAQPGSACWSSGNPLQASLPPGATGTVTLCTNGGAGVCRTIGVGQ